MAVQVLVVTGSWERRMRLAAFIRAFFLVLRVTGLLRLGTVDLNP
jgi:hypothetical protein